MPSVALSQKALATTSTCYFCVSPHRRRPKSANQWDGDAMDRQPRKTARSNAFESSVARWECDDDGARDRDETRLRARVIDRRSARQRHSQSLVYPGRRNLYRIVGDGEVDFRVFATIGRSTVRTRPPLSTSGSSVWCGVGSAVVEGSAPPAGGNS